MATWFFLAEKVRFRIVWRGLLNTIPYFLGFNLYSKRTFNQYIWALFLILQKNELMTTYTITINENNPKGKSLIDLIRAMDEVATIVSEGVAREPESPYNKKFVQEIQKSRKSKGQEIRAEDLWL